LLIFSKPGRELLRGCCKIQASLIFGIILANFHFKFCG